MLGRYVAKLNGWEKETFGSGDSKGHITDLNICPAEWLRPLSPARNRYVQIKHNHLRLSGEKELKPELAAWKVREESDWEPGQGSSCRPSKGTGTSL